MVSKNELSPVAKKVLEKMAKTVARWPDGYKVAYSLRKSDWKGLAGAQTLVGKGLAIKNEDGAFELTEEGRKVGGVGQEL